MSNSAAQFTGDIPLNYDQGLGPHIFEDFAADIARRAAALKPKSVLELAAGTGIVSRKLRDLLPADAALTITDLNQAMLDVAKTKFKPSETVTFQTADAMKLPFGDGAFDVIVAQFGVMFFPDKPASFKEAKRVLKTGGSYLFNVWGAMERNPFSQVAHETTARFFPNNPPAFYQTPFGYHDVARITADLKTGGFSNIAHEVLRIEKRVSDYSLFARGLIYGNPLIAEIKERGAKPDEVHAAIAKALSERFGPAPSSMPLECILFRAS